MSEKAWKIWLGFCIFLAISWLVQDRYFHHLHTKRTDEARADQRLRDYMACEGPACDGLYPEAALLVKKAEAAATNRSER